MLNHKCDVPVSNSYLKAKRRAVESLYCGRMFAYHKIKEFNNETCQTESYWLCHVFNEPCRIIRQSSGKTTKDELAKKSLQIKLLCRPELEIDAGSQIKVKQHGKDRWYKCSGESEHHSDHQSIPLEILEEQA